MMVDISICSNMVQFIGNRVLVHMPFMATYTTGGRPWEQSELGYPLTDVENVAEGEDGSISYFQGGSVRVFSNNGTVQVYQSKDYADIIMGQNDIYDIY